MSTAPLRRPLCCLKTPLRPNPQQRTVRRLLATAAESSQRKSSTVPPQYTVHTIPDLKRSTVRTAFAVYPPPPPPPPSGHPTALAALHAQQIALMDPTGARTRLFDRHSPTAAKPGDVLMVTTRRAAEPFAGVCLSVRRRGIDTAVLLRGQLMRVGVEMWFKVYSRNVAGIEVIHRRKKRARRARLYYMRLPKHDMGSVEHLVLAWRKSRNVVRSSGKGGAAAAAAKKKKKA